MMNKSIKTVTSIEPTRIVRFRTPLVPLVLVLLVMLATSNWIEAGDSAAMLPSERLYEKWKQSYTAAGGDTNVAIGLGPIRGLSPERTASGTVQLNLPKAMLSVTLTDINEAYDVWLVDNQSDADGSILPDEGDDLFRVGRIRPRGNRGQLHNVDLGTGFFDDFELDLIAVCPADQNPINGVSLVGSRSSFERRYTRERLSEGGVSPVALEAHDSATGVDPRVQLGLVSQQVLDGGDLFFRGTFEGNGRSCATCHRVRNNLVVDPNFIQRQRRRNPNDPIFIADPGRPGGVPELEKPELLEKFGLILENVDGFEDPGNKFLMRSVPHNLSMATTLTPPEPDENGDLPDGSNLTFEQRTGWSGDGVFPPGTLRLFPVGAVIQHYTRDFDIREPGPDSFRLQTDEELDALEAFLLSTGRLNNLDLSQVALTGKAAERGRILFTTGPGGGKCFGCHNNAGANSAFGGNRNINTGIERVRIARLEELNIPADGGFGGQNLDEFNFDSDEDGINDSFGNGTFNIPPLVEAADTPPFFHTNAFNTIEAAVGFYSTDTFANSPGGALVETVFGEGINLSKDQSNDIAAFLRVINAAFNLDIAIQRIEAARSIGGSFGLSQRRLNNTLISLANEELNDALRVLKQRRLNNVARDNIAKAISANREVLRSKNVSRRAKFSGLARRHAIRAKKALGSGLNFEMGEGNLVF